MSRKIDKAKVNSLVFDIVGGRLTVEKAAQNLLEWQEAVGLTRADALVIITDAYRETQFA